MSIPRRSAGPADRGRCAGVRCWRSCAPYLAALGEALRRRASSTSCRAPMRRCRSSAQYRLMLDDRSRSVPSSASASARTSSGIEGEIAQAEAEARQRRLRRPRAAPPSLRRNGRVSPVSNRRWTSCALNSSDCALDSPAIIAGAARRDRAGAANRSLTVDAPAADLSRARAPQLPLVLFRPGPVADRHLAAASGDVLAHLPAVGLGAASGLRHVLPVHRRAVHRAGGGRPCRSRRSPSRAADHAVGDAGAGRDPGGAGRDGRRRRLARGRAGAGAGLRLGVRHSAAARDDRAAGRAPQRIAECHRAEFTADQLRARRRPGARRSADRGGRRGALLRPQRAVVRRGADRAGDDALAREPRRRRRGADGCTAGSRGCAVRSVSRRSAPACC